ncbi:MAG: TIGR00730 family Rossman fold protein [Chloroflexota bacterium]|nr:TIGR00730 family Rossman fold protein [Chloroflexota bacterium]
MPNGKEKENQSKTDGKRGQKTASQTPSSKTLQKLNEPLSPNTSLNRSNRLGEPTEDEQLLRKPHTNHDDFTHSDTWRVLRITGEFVSGFDTLASVGAAVTCFGSARVRDDDPMYWKGVELARRLAEEGFAIITGGGPGMMEAANRGAKEANGISIGCNIELPFEQGTNAYVDISINFRYFFVRKTMFMKYSEGFVIFPGGFGTMDELFEALTLVQTGKVRDFPLVLFGSDYWGGLIEWIKGPMLAERKIAPEDLGLLTVTDSVDEAAKIIIDSYKAMSAQVEDANSEAAKVQAELLDDPGALHIPERNRSADGKAHDNHKGKEPKANASSGRGVAKK